MIVDITIWFGKLARIPRLTRCKTEKGSVVLKEKLSKQAVTG